MKHMMIDPPSGWQYGFPKPIPEDQLGRVNAWLVENGYPQAEIDACGKHFYYRCWTHDDGVPDPVPEPVPAVRKLVLWRFDDFKAAAGASIISVLLSSVGMGYAGLEISHFNQGIMFVTVYVAYMTAIRQGWIK
jgi:hypothetical protein